MVQMIANRRDIDFVLYEQLDAVSLTKSDRFKGMNKKFFDMVITEARNFAIKEVLPLNEMGDQIGVTFEDNKVKVPDCFHRPYELMRKGGYTSLTEDPDWGGQGLPNIIARAVLEYIQGADFAFSAYGTLTRGAARMIETFGTEKQKDMFLENMYMGKWGGTMVLTEPEAGSDVGNLTTSAKKNPDGTYSISGNKIFITNGDHDLTENIVHPVLARLEGAPAGTKGISLFIVPKIWVNEDGSLGDPNDVVCIGVEEKMGLHASPTCQLSFGSRGNCRGLLLGEENQGMRVMFQMMNEARLGVGSLGLFNASCAYLYTLDYTLQRKQGRDIEKLANKEAPQVPIVQHPDVRRMLMWMKTHVEGMRSFVYYVAFLFDQIECADSGDEKREKQELVDLLTPVIKAYCTDRGFDATVMAMQCFGGYGYTREYPIERLLRNSKINSIYEGTNGIQAMDLLGRKIGMKKGAVFFRFIEMMKKTVDEAKAYPILNGPDENMGAAIDRLTNVANFLIRSVASNDFRASFAHAVPFLDAFGDVIIGWMHLWRAAVAAPKLEKLIEGAEGQQRLEKISKNKNAAFYDGQIQSAVFFIQTILPVSVGKMNAIKNNCKAAIEISESSLVA